MTLILQSLESLQDVVPCRKIVSKVLHYGGTWVSHLGLFLLYFTKKKKTNVTKKGGVHLRLPTFDERDPSSPLLHQYCLIGKTFNSRRTRQRQFNKEVVSSDVRDESEGEAHDKYGKPSLVVKTYRVGKVPDTTT